ncbi:Alpha/Beta hydrolase protein [Mycena epipterygia]|nr:Alpha/Beta hydrolase protein [Mycena epipterygia]
MIRQLEMNRALSLLVSSLALLADNLLNNDSGIHPPVVKLSYGPFQGTVVGNVTQFLGMPFAQPPVGEFRFREPREPVKFVELRMADTFGPACPQQTLSRVPGRSSAAQYRSISEDCLTINVLKPNRGHKLPVLVWFHGGAFEIGSAGDSGMSSLVERSLVNGKPVIVVLPNYRVNAFGFLAGKEVKDAGVSNLGLRDQQFALEWVQKHISAFGGDPNQVIISGLSAGALSVGMHLISSNVAPKFHGAFMESGCAPSIPTITEGQPQYDQLVAATNCSQAADSLDCLRHAPFDILMSAINQTPNVFSYSSLGNVWKPRIDGDIIKHHPFITMSRGLHAKVPIIAGNCEDEGTIFTLPLLNITTDHGFLEYMHNNYFPGVSRDKILQLGELYPADPAAGSPFGTGRLNAITPEFKRLAAVQGDLIFQAPCRLLLSKASITQDVWGFIYKRGKSTPILGASHCSDSKEWLARNTTDFFAIDGLIQFINTLDPNIPTSESGSFVWPKWNTLKSGALLSFVDSSGLEIISDDFRDEPIAFLNNISLQAAQKLYAY